MGDRYALVGNPVAHSKSPLIHAAFARATSQDLDYGLIEAPANGWSSATTLASFAISAAILAWWAFVNTSKSRPHPAQTWLIVAMVYTFGRISGGHFNPAVSVGAALSGRLTWKETTRRRVSSPTSFDFTLLSSGGRGFGSGIGSSSGGASPEMSSGGESGTDCSAASLGRNSIVP